MTIEHRHFGKIGVGASRAAMRFWRNSPTGVSALPDLPDRVLILGPLELVARRVAGRRRL